jgi:uncharacterized protein
LREEILMPEAAGYAAAVGIGIALGLVGGGGSILTVPVLVYLFQTAVVPATGYSLFIVGLTALTGAIAYMRNGLVNYRAVLLFGLPSLTAVYVTRSMLLPALPEELFTLIGLRVTRDLALMTLFALLMLGASVTMIRNRESRQPKARGNAPWAVIALEGVTVGVLTGLVGAGGGFLIIPALVILARLPMKTAIGSSLVIIAIKSLVGFTGDLPHLDVDWHFLLTFTALAVAGSIPAALLARHLPTRRLEKAFGYLTMLVGAAIILREVFIHAS